MKQLNAQAMEKALSHIVQKLGIDWLKNSKRFHSAVADVLPGFEYEAERKALCACIGSEVSEKIINATSKSQSEKQRVLNSCVKYLTSQQKLTEQQTNALVKVFTHVLWKEASYNTDNIVVKHTPQTFFAKTKKEAESGDVEAQFRLGFLYDHGLGTNEDKAEAVKWYRKAAEQGHTLAQSCLIQLGQVTSQEVVRSTTVSNTSSTKVGGIATVAKRGNTQTQEMTEKAKLLRKANDGDVEAQYSLGNCYYNGSHGLMHNEMEAVGWYRKAAEQGHTEAQYRLGDHYYRIKKYGKAFRWLHQAAKHGHTEAQCKLGECYCHGWGTNKDEAEAIKWFRQAVKHGHIEAQYNLGDCYYYGFGVDKDEVEAVKWYRKAAEQGYDLAQSMLGHCYEFGFGVSEDEAEAIKWYSRASDKVALRCLRDRGSKLAIRALKELKKSRP